MRVRPCVPLLRVRRPRPRPLIVAVAQEDANNQQTEVKRYQSGDYFGERALIKNDNRAASVVAITDCRCILLDKWSFERLLVRPPVPAPCTSACTCAAPPCCCLARHLTSTCGGWPLACTLDSRLPRPRMPLSGATRGLRQGPVRDILARDADDYAKHV